MRAELLEEDHFHWLLRGSSLTLIGMIEQPSRLYIDLHEYCGLADLRVGSRLSLFGMLFDDNPLDESLFTKSLDIWFLPVSIDPPDLKGNIAYIGLLLLETGEKDGEYTCIGLFEARDYPRESLIRQSLARCTRRSTLTITSVRR